MVEKTGSKCLQICTHVFFDLVQQTYSTPIKELLLHNPIHLQPRYPHRTIQPPPLLWMLTFLKILIAQAPTLSRSHLVQIPRDTQKSTYSTQRPKVTQDYNRPSPTLSTFVQDSNTNASPVPTPPPSSDDYKISLLVYKALSNKGPKYLAEMLVKHQPPRALRSANQNLLTELKTRKLYGERAFAFSGPYLWNKLPPHVRESESVAIFKTNLKTHLFSAAFQL